MKRAIVLIAAASLLAACGGNTKPKQPNQFQLAIQERSNCIKYKRQRDPEADALITMLERENPDRFLTDAEANILARYESTDTCNERLVSAWGRLNPAHGQIWAERSTARNNLMADMISQRITPKQYKLRFDQLHAYTMNQLKTEDQKLSANEAAVRAEKQQKLWNTLSNMSCSRAFGGLGCNNSTGVQRPKPAPSDLNRSLVSETPIVGGALCKYSDGTVTRISGSYCPR